MKFIVDVPSIDNVASMKSKLMGYGSMLYYSNFEVTEYKETPKLSLHIKKTGVLMSPAEIAGGNDCVYTIEFLNDNKQGCYLNKGNEHIGKRLVISEHVYPESFYKDIQETVDWSMLPKGSVVKLVQKNGSVRVLGIRKFVKCDGKFLWFLNSDESCEFSLLPEDYNLEIIRFGE